MPKHKKKMLKFNLKNALIVEDSKFKVKECDLIANVLKWKYLWQWFYVRYNIVSRCKNSYIVL